MDRLWYLIPIVVLVVLIVWGPSKLPEVGAGMGRAIREFRHAMSGKDPATVDSVAMVQNPASGHDGAAPRSDDWQPATVPDDTRRG